MLTNEIVFSQPSWVVRSNTVRLAITQLGAQMAPVCFYANEKDSVQPYYVSPWQCEEHSVSEGQPEQILRGDFFCLPFGHAEPEDGVPSHGRTAGGRWSFDRFSSANGIYELCIRMPNALNSGSVTRQFFLRDGENVIYDRTTITGLEGAYTLGHHAILRVPQREFSLLISTGRQIVGMTSPRRLPNLREVDIQSLAMGAIFDDLARVPSISSDRSSIDCSAYPARRGFSDLLQIATEPESGQPAWTAAVNTQERYLWFALRNAALLPSTLLWIENCGRQYPPWNGRNNSLGIEDVCSYFDLGSKAAAAPNAFSERGIRTVQHFRSDLPLSIPYIQGAVRTPPGFGQVRSMHCGQRSVTFVDSIGTEVTVSLSPGFLFGDTL